MEVKLEGSSLIEVRTGLFGSLLIIQMEDNRIADMIAVSNAEEAKALVEAIKAVGKANGWKV